jgi:hypothetical protein
MNSEKYKEIIEKIQDVKLQSEMIQIELLSGKKLRCIIVDIISKRRFLSDGVETVDYPTFLKINLVNEKDEVISKEQIVDIFEIVDVKMQSKH